MSEVSVRCCICGDGPMTGPTFCSVHRINAKGVKGIWACEKHIKQTDGKTDPELMELVHILEHRP